MEKKRMAGTGGDRYIPYEDRTGDESVVYFTRDLSADGLKKIYDRIGQTMKGRDLLFGDTKKRDSSAFFAVGVSLSFLLRADVHPAFSAGDFVEFVGR